MTPLPVARAGWPLRFPTDLERAFHGHYFRQSLPYVRFALAVSLFLLAGFGILEAQTPPAIRSLLWHIRYGLVCPCIAALIFLTYARGFARVFQPAMVLGTLAMALPAFGARVLINSPGIDKVILGNVVLIIMGVYTLSRLQLAYASFVGWTMTLAYGLVVGSDPSASVPLGLEDVVNLCLANVLGMCGAYTIERYARGEFLLMRESERLLLNILPAAVAERLKRREETIADSFPEATVLFADIVGFAALAASTSPTALVRSLNDIFSAFDGLTERHGLEKIKTVGDEYMVAGGLPTRRADHAEAVAEMALDMQEAMRRFTAPDGRALRLRIGIHTGPVIAGVIGARKFAYDLWGDTVNLASRMESHGEAGGIQVSSVTQARLGEKYQFSEPRSKEVKGYGEMITYLLLGRGTSAPMLQPEEP